jgi:hypothetical protein
MNTAPSCRRAAGVLLLGLCPTGCADPAPMAPGPTLTLTPSQAALELALRRTAEVEVVVQRSGYAGPVTIHAEALPDGVLSDSVVMAAHQHAATLRFTAAATAPQGEAAISLRAAAPALAATASLTLRIIPTPEPAATCDGAGGTMHRGAASGAWQRWDGPHRLADTVFIRDSLVIEEGVLVCAEAAGALAIGAPPGEPPALLRVRGSPALPVRLVSTEPGRPWGGVAVDPAYRSFMNSARVEFSHTVLEDARVGIAVGYAGRVAVEAVVLRRIAGAAIHGRDLEARDVTIDGACAAIDDPADCAAVLISSYGFASLQQVRVLRSGGAGVSVLWRSGISLSDVRIDGSRGIGLVLDGHASGPAALSHAAALRIASGLSYPASIHMAAVDVLLGSTDPAALTGNARDTLWVDAGAGGTARYVRITPELPWVVRAGQGLPSSVEELEMLPGAVLLLDGALWLRRVVVAGTPASPAAIRADVREHALGASLRLQGGEGAGSTMRHILLERVMVSAAAGHQVQLEDVTILDGYLAVHSNGSRLARLTSQGSLPRWPGGAGPPWEYLPGQLPADLIVIDARDVRLTGCELTGSLAGALQVVVSTEVQIRDCNIHGNAGVGLRSTAAEPVDARHNWWGSPGGPFAPGGAGASGPALLEPFRTQPFRW